MYYITNQNNQIIAADTELLALFDVKNIDELYKEIALGNINFSSTGEEEKITITTVVEEKIYDAEYNELSGLLGNMTLVQIQSSEESNFIDEDISAFIAAENEELSEDKEENELIDNLLNLDIDLDIDKEDEIPFPDDDLISIKEEENIAISEDEISLLLNDEVSEEKETVEESIEKSIIEDNDDELFDLLLPDTAEDTIDEIPEVSETDTSPIYIDIENICQKIGISTDDYNIFLNEFIDTALSVEKDLQNTEDKKYLNAINTLSHLSNVLHLPIVTTSVTQIKNAAADEQDSAIASFYATLGRLTTSQPETGEKESFKEETPFISEIDSKPEIETIDAIEMDTIEIYDEEPLPAVDFESVISTKESFGIIKLDDVKPIHFDFQLEEAAKDLSLPVELIEEFVHDFIEQAHLETKKMLEAYENGDLDTIQKIGHLLKGTASNLRINTLSDTLYEIQFCEDSSKLENLIKQYWGHFLSLENQINLASR
jgi:HPt (histidine-containing phosphotransfer) domain-containing protein